MKIAVLVVLVLLAAGAEARTPGQQYPSCDLATQHALKGATGGMIKDPRQAHITTRADILQADLGSARTARHLTQTMTDRLDGRVAAVRAGADRYTRQQGFLSAAEVASYDRALDAVAARICHR